MSNAQQKRLESLHPTLQKIVEASLAIHAAAGFDWDMIIVSGHRTRAEQDDCVRRKVSSCVWPSSPHNMFPSLAVDLQSARGGALVGGDEAVKHGIEIAKIMCKVAMDMGIALKWGGLWTAVVPSDAFEQIVKNNQLRAKKIKTNKGQTTWVDVPHYELKNEWDAVKRDPKKLIEMAVKK